MRKSAGPNDIRPAIVKPVMNISCRCACKLFSITLNCGLLSLDWKVAAMVIRKDTDAEIPICKPHAFCLSL